MQVAGKIMTLKLVLQKILNRGARNQSKSPGREKFGRRGIDTMKKNTQVILLKKFSYGTKVIYRGTLRKAQRMIPPSKKNQYQIKEVI